MGCHRGAQPKSCHVEGGGGAASEAASGGFQLAIEQFETGVGPDDIRVGLIEAG